MSPAETIALTHTVGWLVALTLVLVTAALFPWEKVKRETPAMLRRRVDELEYELTKLQRTVDDSKRYFDAQTDEMKLERSRYIQARS